MKLREGAKLVLLDELLCLSPNYISVSSCISFLTRFPVYTFPPFRPGCKRLGERPVLSVLGRDRVYMCMHILTKTLGQLM